MYGLTFLSSSHLLAGTTAGFPFNHFREECPLTYHHQRIGSHHQGKLDENALLNELTDWV
jgi:hypothetical protein